MYFDVIESDFNIADETFNFGARGIGDNANLHEITTIATLKSSDENAKSDVDVGGFVHDKKVFFHTHNTVRVFQDRCCNDIIFNMEFDEVVDVICVSINTQFLIICLRNGTVHVVDFQSDEKDIIFSEALLETDGQRAFVNCFIQEEAENCTHFLLVTCRGVLFSLTVHHNVDTKVSCNEKLKFGHYVNNAAFSYPNLIVNGLEMSVLDVVENSLINDEGLQLKKLCSLGRKFLGLTNDGKLLSICANTLFTFTVNRESNFQDISVISTANQHHLLAVTENEHSNYLELFTFNESSTVFSIKITNEPVLLQEESLEEETIFLSKISQGTQLVELRFCMVNETESERRLERLLRQHKFEEAEEFAAIYKLDVRIINMARVESTMNDICGTEEIDKLFELLERIDDVEFKLTACCAADTFCAHLSDVRRVLVYGATLSLVNCDELLNKQKLLISLLYKFDTFVSLNATDSVQEWLRFADRDLIDVLLAKLRQHDIDDAIRIYSRLGEGLSDKLTDNQLKEILKVLNEFTLAEYRCFLPTFIPTTFTYRPTALPIFVNWIINKIYLIERDDNVHFPENAITFTDIVLGQLKTDSRSVRLKGQCTLLNHNGVNILSDYVDFLKDIQTLKNNYCININLREYKSAPTCVVRILLQVRMCAEDYEQFLSRFLCSFMIKKNLDHNEILLNEIKHLVNFDERQWNHLVGPILNCISSVELKLTAVKIILQKANVPWGEIVRKIGYSVLHYTHPLVDQIKSVIADERTYEVLRRPAYKFTELDILKRNLEWMLYRIMHVNLPTAIEDAFTFHKNEPHLVSKTVAICLIRQGKYDDALAVLSNTSLGSEFIHNICESIIRFAAIHMNSKTRQMTHYYNIINSLYNLYEANKSTKRMASIDSEYIQNIRNVYHIYHGDFKLDVKTSDLCCDKGRKKVYAKLLDEVVNNFNVKANIKQCLTQCKQIATYVSMQEEQVLIDFCRTIENFNGILAAAEYLYENDVEARALCLAALLLLKYSNSNSINEQTLFNETLSFDEVGDTTIDNSLQLALKLVHKAIVKANVYDFSACMEVMNWVEVCVTNNKISAKGGGTNGVQEISESAALRPVRRIFELYCSYVAQYKHRNLVYLTYLSGDYQISQEDLLKEIQILPCTVDNLCKDGQISTAYNLISTLQSGLGLYGNLDKKVLAAVNSIVVKKCVPYLLNFLVMQNNVNESLLFTLLLGCDQNDAINYIYKFLRTCKRHPDKLRTVSQTALKLWDYYDIQISKEPLITSILTVKWWKGIALCKIPYDTFFKSTASGRLELMIKFNYINERSLEEYCKDFSLDVQHFYKIYLKYTLTNYKPEHEVVVDVIGKKKLVLKSTEDELINKCLNLMDFLKNEDAIVVMLNEIWNEVNVYYYEVFECILKIRKVIGEVGDYNANLEALNFLKRYQRVSAPSQMETEQWYTMFPDKHALDPLSEFRLPFTPSLFTSQIWNIIRPEINLKTYRFWITMTDLLNAHLNDNDICAIAVKDVVKNGILGDKEQTEEWCLMAKHEDLFQEIDKCLERMSNLEVCTSAIYHVMTHTPKGADQVDAAALCYKYAMVYKERFPHDEGIEKAFKKVSNKYLSLSAIHILYTFRLNDEQYLELVNQPEELIIALYMDKRILKRMDAVDLYCPDINSATNSLAQVFSLNIFKIRTDLLTSYLSNSSLSSDLNSTLLMIHCNQQEGKNDCNDDNLKRSAYICAHNIPYWQDHLLKLTEEANKSHLYRARALKCFCIISDKEEIKEMTGLDFDEFLNYIDKLVLLSELENFGFEMDVTKLDECNKKGLLKRLVKQGDKSKSINVMAAVCMTYNMYELKYWEFIINSAISLKMFKELKVFMEFVKNCHYKAFSVNAWQMIIDNEFSLDISEKSQDEIVEMMVENYLIIQSCPVLYSLNFENIIKKCLELRRSTFAVILLQYLPESKRDVYVQEIKKTYDSKLLRDLSERGVWGVQEAESYLK